jgi:hypothetical protein
VEQSAMKELAERLVAFNSQLQREFSRMDTTGTG